MSRNFRILPAFSPTLLSLEKIVSLRRYSDNSWLKSTTIMLQMQKNPVQDEADNRDGPWQDALFK